MFTTLPSCTAKPVLPMFPSLAAHEFGVVPIGMSVFFKSPKEFGTSEGLLRFLFVLCKMLAQRSS